MAMTTNSTAAAALVQVVDNNTTACIVSLMGTMPLADIRRMLVKHASPSALRRRALDDRDAAIRQLAATYAAASGRAMADAVHRDLQRYAASAYRFERNRPPSDPTRVLLHRVLAIGDGRVPSFELIRRALGGSK
jgi:hypothetical protein